LTRPFEKHLDSDELDVLVTGLGRSESDSPQLSQTVLAEAQRHVESCQNCSRKVQMHKSVQSEISHLEASSQPLGSNCVGEAIWLEAAAGLLPGARAMELVNHAAQCARCGPLLREAAEGLVDETTPIEEALLASLSSARPGWAKKTVGTLLANWNDPEQGLGKQRMRSPFSWLHVSLSRLVLALVVVTVVAMVGWLGFERVRRPSADKLLAQAYTEQRTIEIRIPGAQFAPMRVDRGPGAEGANMPPSFYEAKKLTRENLQNNPTDPLWLQLDARADLLSGNYDAAVKSLQRALESLPESPKLLADLGSAYFLRAEKTGHAEDYGSAIDFLSKALTKLPNDPVVLFNHALACEGGFLRSDAKKDWEHYLEIDSRSEWANEARANLQRLNNESAEIRKRRSLPLLSPLEFSAAFGASRESDLTDLNDRVEQYLDMAVRSWLPQLYRHGDSSPHKPVETRRALDDLAAMMRGRHDDDWLSDFLQITPSPPQGKALEWLLASEEALQGGRYDQSVKFAQKSVVEFHSAKNEAGTVRASFAVILAQSLALEFADCAKTASALTPLLSGKHYGWLAAQISIQEGECQDGPAQSEDAIRNISKGEVIARNCHYPGVELRAIALAAARRSDMGASDQAFRDVVDALRSFWSSDAPPERGEALYSVLSDIALARDLRYVDMFATEETLVDFPPSDPVDLAVQHEILAETQERVGEHQAARATLQRTATEMSTLPGDRAVGLRKAEISLEIAKIQLSSGDANGAIATLAEIRPQFESLDAGLFQATYFKVYGETSLALGFGSAAQPLLERALSFTEVGLRGFRREADKLVWSELQGQIYRDLLEIKISSRSPADALAWWEWYKGASLRVGEEKDSLAATARGKELVPPPLSTFTMPRGTAVVSYAVLQNSATAFVFHDGIVNVHDLRLPKDANLGELRFLSLCLDPSANLGLFGAESRRLYDLLVAPLESDIHGLTALRFETDGALDRIPFNLLESADGRYLSDRFNITYSPGLAYSSRSQVTTISAANRVLVVVGQREEHGFLPPLPEAAEEGQEVASHFQQASLLTGSEVTRPRVLKELKEAQEFHFVGHAVASSEQIGLVLGQDSVLTAQDLMLLRPRNLRLAVLSACGTANGDDGTFSDVNSLARTLVAAGIPEVVASRWNVDSVATHQLMRAFYSSLISGKSPADSLRIATRAIRSLPGYQHPYYWGSFAVFGN
jgi:tetratricopeptide (TPR) repeat protein